MRTFTNFQFWMEKRLLMLLLFSTVLLLGNAVAQVSLYSFSQSSGTYTPITGGTVLGNTSSDDQRFVDPAVPLGGTTLTGPGFPIGFSFNYNGIAFDRFAVNNNGWISLGQSSLTPSVDINSTSSYTPLSSTATNTPALLRNRIAAVAADLQAQTGSELRIETVGSAPNRSCVIQWTNYKRFSTSGTGQNLTFQIRLNEGGGVAANQTVDIVFGTMVFNTTSSTAHVGLGGTVSTDFNNRQTTAPHDWNATTAGTLNTSSCTFVSTGTPPVSGTAFTWTPPASCMGTPVGGTTVSTANPACSGVSFTLSLTGATIGSGITYQWQSSPNGSGYTDIGGATNPTYTTSQTTATYYRCRVTCTASGQSANSTGLQITMNPPTQCYCIPPYTTGCTSSDRIDQVTVGTLVNPPSGTALGYTQYLSGLPVPNLAVGGTQAASVLVGPGGTEHVKIFIDLNQDGDFDDTGEENYLGSANGALVSGTITIPAGALTGITRMRVRVVYNTNVFTACSSHTYGEAEDYLVNLVMAPSCAANPTSPANGSSSCPQTGATTLSWPAVSGATSYDVYFGTSPNPPLAASNVSGTSYNAGVLGIGTYYWQIIPKNGAGSASGCAVWSFTYADNQAPVITNCGGNQTLTANASCQAVLDNYTGNVQYTENCSGAVTVTQNPAAGTVISGATVVTFTVKDAVNNTSTCSITVNLMDNTPPVLNCPNVQAGTSSNSCNAVVNYNVTATDNCTANVSLLRLSGPASGSTFPLGATAISYQGTDAANNTATCSFTVTVSDDDAPLILTCPPNVSVTTDDNCESITANYTGLVVASDNCDANPTVVQNPAPGTVSGGFLTITMTVTDDAGNSSTCSFQTTAEDMSAPTISCPDPQTFNADADCQTPLPDFTGLADATDNCGVFLVTQEPAPGTEVGFGQTLVTLTVTDGAGLSNSCLMEAYSVDVTPPVLTCPPSVTLNTDPNTCTAVAMYICPLAPDNCSGSANPEHILGLPSGSAFPKGVNVVGFQATDASGNSSTCTFTITVIDVEPPYLSCPPNIVKSTDPNQCSAVTTWSAPTTHDNCDVPTLVQAAGPFNGSAFPKGTTTVLFRSTDSSGNMTTCSFTVTVNDNELPTITCPANIVKSNDLNQCGAVVTFATPAFNDNCPGAVISQIGGLASGAFFPKGVTTNIFKVTDASGNTATCSFTVTVNDTQLPTITCPGNIVKSNDLNQCGAVVTYATPTFSDNCPGATIMLVSGLPSGSFFPVGVTTNVWKVTDASGNTATCSFTVTVNDTQNPTFVNCPGNITQVNDPGVCGAVVKWPKITATDNCPGVVVSFVSGMASGSLFAVGSTTVVYKATDAAGNMASCTFLVTVVDNEDPKITCPPDIQKNNDYNKCSAVIAFIGTATATDNCSVSGITNNGIGTYPVGMTNVTWTAVDNHGNDVTCVQKITVVDGQYPVANCPGDIHTVNDPNLPCQAAVTYTTSVSDNCPGVIKEVSEWPHSENGLFSIGTTMVMVIATDAAGNQTMCTFNIIVDPAPEICNGLDDDCDGLVDETDNAWRQTDKTAASDGKASDLFGASVSVFANYAVVGAKNAGVAYILKSDENNPDSWEQVAVLNPPQVDATDEFGASVAIANSLIVVGAPQDDDLGTDAGAAYIFAKNASNTWNLVKKITAADGFAGDNFGNAVSVSGDNVLIGASMNDEKGLNAGSAYLFGKNQGGANNWGQVTKITAADGQAGDMFGASLDLDADLAVIGANLDDDKGVNAGSAYVFGKDQGGANAWGQVKKLTASDGAPFDNFGVSVGVNGDVVIVGANLSDAKGSNSGSAYLFERNFGGVTDSWVQSTKLLAQDGTASDQLGISVAVNGTFAVAGARFDNIKGTNSGVAYVWEHQPNGTWEYVSKLYDAQGDKNDQFGTVLDVYKRTVIVGALCDDMAGKTDQGSVSFFAAGCDDKPLIGNSDPNNIIKGGNVVHSTEFGVKAYPQPFSDVLNIELSLKAATNIRVVIWNAYGQEVATVYNGSLEGSTTLRWDSARFASGTYFLRVEADDKTEVRPIVLVR